MSEVAVNPQAQNEIIVGHQTTDIFLRDVIILQQIRQEFDEDALNELADKMDVSGVSDDGVEIELIHSPTVARLDGEAFLQYLKDHEQYYGITHDASAFTPSERGYYNVLIAGERRSRAIEIMCLRKGWDINSIKIQAVQRSISFDYALSLQSRENTSAKLNPIEDAISIERHFRYLQAKNNSSSDEQLHGVKPRAVEIAKHFGFNETKVRDALVFVGLPKELQEVVADGLITYSNAVLLGALLEAYLKYLPRRHVQKYTHDPTLIQVDAEANVLIFCEYADARTHEGYEFISEN